MPHEFTHRAHTRAQPDMVPSNVVPVHSRDGKCVTVFTVELPSPASSTVVVVDMCDRPGELSEW